MAPRPKKLSVGTRVRHQSGRLGTIEKELHSSHGYLVRFDERVSRFEGETSRIRGVQLTPTDPKLHDWWESLWPSFMDRSWAKEAS